MSPAPTLERFQCAPLLCDQQPPHIRDAVDVLQPRDVIEECAAEVSEIRIV
jgi:hypothetical protein